MLGILQRFPLSGMSPTGSNTIHLFAEANKLAFADRNRYLADPDFVTVPSAGPDQPDYLQQRSRLIDPARSMGRATAGNRPASLSLWQGQRPGVPIHLAFEYCGSRRAGGQHDQLHRRPVWQPADGERLPAEQPADRLFLPPG
jgi:hypothetical protein